MNWLSNPLRFRQIVDRHGSSDESEASDSQVSEVGDAHNGDCGQDLPTQRAEEIAAEVRTHVYLPRRPR